MGSVYIDTMVYARSLRSKFDYYLVALNFTVLALAVQSANLTTSKVETSFELFGWALLLVAGIFGIYRLEKQPGAYENIAKISAVEKELSELRERRDHGTSEVIYPDQDSTPKSIESEIAIKSAWLEKNKPCIKLEDLRQKRGYKNHRNFFIFGLISLIVSRSYVPLISLI